MSLSSQTQTSNKVEHSKLQTQKQAQFALKIKQHDQIKLLLKKLTILKEGVLAQRRRKAQLKGYLQQANNNINKYQEENRRKQKKHEDLTAQIKKLKDSLIEQRNRKHKIYEELREKEQALKIQAPNQQNNTNLGLFGFRSLFNS